MTPLRRLTGAGWLVRVRRLIGLFSFFYAVIHLLIYLVFDRGMVFTELAEDIAKRPYITVGFTTWLILLALAATSPQRVLRWMGGRRWQALHRLIYLAAPLAVVHFLWSQKKDIRLPLVYAAVLAMIFAARWLAARSPRATRVAEGRAGR